MSTGRKILNLLIAAVLIATAVILFFMKEDGILIVMAILGISLLIYGIRRLVYYFTMARHMVGGRSMLYIGILVVDAAFFTLTVFDGSPVYVMLYLIVVYLLSGVFEILHAMEEKKMGAPSWKRTLAFAIVNLLLAVVCGIFIRSGTIAIYIYCIGLLYSAIKRIVDTFRRTEILYIAP